MSAVGLDKESEDPVSGGLGLGTLQQAVGGVHRGKGCGETASVNQSRARLLFVSTYKVFAHGNSALRWVVLVDSPDYYFYHHYSIAIIIFLFIVFF